ncbi:MAG: hypothetical protein JSU05_09580, partial [Bacteroidetes bacterium]|nr:hypothetical protein [Bacteroidota bacterium]
MSEPLHDIDKLFADNIESYSEKPPADVWDKIDAGLDKKSADIFRKKYRSLRKVAAILLFLFLGAVAYEMISHFNNNQEAENTNKHSVSNSGTNKESVTSANNTNNQTKKDKTNPGNISVSPGDSTNSVNIQPGETVKAETTTTTPAQSVDENNKVIKSANNQGTDNVTAISSDKKNKKPNKVVITTANAAIAESSEKNNRNNNLSVKKANSDYKMEVTQARIDHKGRNEADNNAAVITDQPADTKRIILPESLLINTYDRVLTTTVFVNEK